MQSINDKEFSKHFSPEISKELENYAINVALLHSRYLFVQRVKGIQFAYCTHCKKSFMTERTLKHNEEVECKKCKSDCIVKNHGRGRKHLIDESYFIFYEKSAVNPEAIVAKGVHATRDYSEDYRDVKEKYIYSSLYLFEPGNAMQMTRNTYWHVLFSEDLRKKLLWEKRSKIHSLYNTSMQSMKYYCDLNSVREAVKGTLFEYSGWEQYVDIEDGLVGFFYLAAKYPSVEYLTKLGFKQFIEEKISGVGTFGAINWRGKSVQSVLRLNKQEINELRQKNIKLSCLDLRYYQYSRKQGSKITFEEAKMLSTIMEMYNTDRLRLIQSYANVDQINKYILRQMKIRFKEDYKNFAPTPTMFMWADYIRDCITLEMDLSQERVLFPRNLHAAHQKTIEQVKIKVDKKLNQKIEERLKSLSWLRFSFKNLFIRPAASSKELIEEGEALRHCVGTYAKRYAEGASDILLIRKKNKPDRPFYTIEIIKGRITQVYGYMHAEPTDEVQDFLEAFENERLKKSKNKKMRR